MKAFPQSAGKGMVRYVIQLQSKSDDEAFNVELIAGRRVLIDASNSRFFGGKIKEETVVG